MTLQGQSINQPCTSLLANRLSEPNVIGSAILVQGSEIIGSQCANLSRKPWYMWCQSQYYQGYLRSRRLRKQAEKVKLSGQILSWCSVAYLYFSFISNKQTNRCFSSVNFHNLYLIPQCFYRILTSLIQPGYCLQKLLCSIQGSAISFKNWSQHFEQIWAESWPFGGGGEWGDKSG